MKKRREIILSGLDPKAMGLEIGPCNHPIAPKSEGYNVEIVDWASTEVLREKYQDDPDLANIEHVDYVWSGGSYADLIGEKHKYDWIIASHVIEHVPDLVSFIQSCQEVLTADGVLSLAVPDKRYCFDQFRSISTIGAVLNAYHSADTKPTVGAIVDYYLNISKKGGNLSWNEKCDPATQSELYYSHQDALKKYTESLENGNYVDVHNWCFTPSSFRLILSDLHELKLIELKEKSFTSTKGGEFFVSLSKNGHGCSMSRLDLLEASLKEQMKPYRSKTRRLIDRLF